MCLGELARVVGVGPGSAQPVLDVTDLDGARRRSAIALLDGPVVGDVVLVHSGFALHRLEQEEASEAALLRRGDLDTPDP